MSILKQFFRYVSMNILGMIGLSCYILADTFFVARGIGENGLSSLNLALPAYSLINGIGLMIGMGGGTRFALAKGSNDNRHNTIFTKCIQMALMFSLTFVLIGVFLSGNISRLLGADATLFDMTNIYIKVVLIFSPMFILNNIVICFVRNDGNPRLAMLAMIIGSLSNVILDYILIFPLQMGMFGAVLATGLSPIVSLMILSFHYLKKKCGFKIKKCFIKFKNLLDISSLGFSSFVTEISNGIVIIIFNFLILRLNGNLGVAAYGIIANLAFVVVSIFTGISQGIQPIISENHAKNNRTNVLKIYKYAIITTLSIALLIYLSSFIFSRQLCNIFNKDNNVELTNIASMGLKIYFIAFFFIGFNIVTATFFSSVNSPKKSFTISFLRGILLIIPISFIMSALLGLNGVWLTLPVTELIVFGISLTLIIRYFLKHKQPKPSMLT